MSVTDHLPGKRLFARPVGGLKAQGALPVRKTPVGTSYTATGLTTPQQANTSEIGSSQPVVIREVVPELSSSYQRIQTYTRMMNDVSVDVSMRAAKTPVLGADFFVDAYSDDPQDLEIAEFVWSNLYEGMNSPLCNSLEDILHMYEDGYAVLEKVYELREWTPKRKAANTRNYTMLRKLGVRPTNTLKGINYDDNGGPKSVSQNAIRSGGKTEDVELDISKIVIFTFGRYGGDLTGKSLLRTAYANWYYKTHFYKIDAIQKERHSLGVPKGRLNPGYTPADKEALRTLLRNLRSNEESFMILPPAVDVEFAEVHGNLVNVLDSAEHHNLMILLNVMAQFLSLGLTSQGGGGGRSTSGSHVDMFMKSLRYVANVICDVINMYIVPELVVWNYPTKNFPKLKVRNIGETRDLQMLGAALANLFAQSAITSDDDTENWIRRVFDMPAKRLLANAANGNGVGPLGNGTRPPQKGNVASNGGQGNVGKPPNAAFGELALHMPQITNESTVNVPDVNVNVGDSPVEVTNEYEFQHQHDIHVHVDEGAVSPQLDLDMPAPVVNIHMPPNEEKEVKVYQVKPKSAIARKREDGSTQIDYIYEDDA